MHDQIQDFILESATSEKKILDPSLSGLGFRPASKRSQMPLTSENINTKAIEFAEKLGNVP
jgi:hypothetical protein